MKYIDNFKKTDSRFEKKYIIKFDQLINFYSKNLNSIEKLHKSNNINNIYFDTIQNDFYDDHIEGNLNRLKARIRWYTNGNNKFFFEIKIKNNFLNYKIKSEIDNFNLDNISLKKINDIYYALISKTDFKNFKYKFIKPTLYNNYDREYFYKKNIKNRITLDKNLYSQKLNINFSKKQKKYFYDNILEHKYFKTKYKDLNIPYIKYIGSSFSKYLHGIE